MELVKDFISAHYIEIIMSLIMSFFLLLLIVIVLIYKTKKSKEKYNSLVRGIDGIDIEKLLIKSDKDIRDLQRDIEIFQKNIDTMETKLSFTIQKIGFIRYSAFDDMGSELSFSIAMLDNFQNGFVFTSIYGREQSVCYAKAIKSGESKIPLSAEEILSIERALKGENLEFDEYSRVKSM